MFEDAQPLSPQDEIKRILGLRQAVNAALPTPPAPVAGGVAAAAPKAAPMIAAPNTALPPVVPQQRQTDTDELNRLKNSTAGVEQLQKKHPIIGTIARIGDIAGSALFPSITAQIPGTELHHAGLINRQQSRVNQDLAGEKEQAQTAGEQASTAHTQAETGAIPAHTKLEEAQTEALQNKSDIGTTPDEVTLHDLMAGDNGRPRINQQTGKPYTYLEAYTAVKQASQNKPEKPDNPQQQLIDAEAAVSQAKTPQEKQVAQANLDNLRHSIGEYAGLSQRPERPGAGNARSDKSYTYNNDKLDKIGKPVEDAMARMGRLRETLAQGTPQADALVAPELLTIMAGGQGSGLRMNEAEIARIVGGRSVWQNLQAQVQHWSTDPSAARSITAEQQRQINALTEAVYNKLLNKQQALDAARERLLDSDDPKEHRRIVNDAHQRMTQIDEGADSAVTQEVEFVRGADGKLHPKNNEQTH